MDFPPSPGRPGTFASEALPHRRVLLAAALRYARDPDIAEDLVQETYLRAYAHWPSYRAGTSCRAWLLRILRNSFFSRYRRQVRRRRVFRESATELAGALHGGGALSMRPPGHTSLADEVVRALGSLDERQRQIVELADLEGLRYREIARRLELPLGTVMSRLFRARRQLETRLATYAASDYGIRRERTGSSQLERQSSAARAAGSR